MLANKKRLIAFIFIFILPILLVGCRNKESKQFDTFLEELFVEEMEANPLDIPYTIANPSVYGLEDVTPSLPNLSQEAFDKDIQRIENNLERLSAFNYEALTDEQQLTYDILTHYYETALMGKDLYEHTKTVSPSLGIQAQLPTFFAEYPIRSEEDIDTYFNLLAEVPDFFAEIIDLKKNKSENNLLMPAFALEKSIAQIHAFTDSTTDNFLIEIFEDKIVTLDNMSSAKVEAFSTAHKEIILHTVIPAYNHLARELHELIHDATHDKGLYYLENGNAYYEYLFASNTGSSKSIEEIIDLINERIALTIHKNQLIAQIDYSVIEAYMNFSYDQDTPENTIDFLIEGMSEDFLDIDLPNLDIKYVHPSLEAHLSPAFYLIPPIDEPNDQVVYINNSQLAHSDYFYTTIAHETYPGHLYQYTFFRNQDVPTIRQILHYPAYSEGWAVYSENYAIEFLEVSSLLSQILQSDRTIDLMIQGRVDIGVNYEGWTLEDTANYLNSLGVHLSLEDVRPMFEYVIEEPANTLKYSIGYLEMLLLLEKAYELDEDLAIKNFHELILKIGPAPFEVIENALENRLSYNDTNKAA
ncbi:uncharacterized protein (DUF885 family) [Natranaerovirga hydrolytica]|uniref:Uncharacterized protein (DUF885 family) n=1 Tax=Natranaerovirga hydrolytica TaxID=680378 RepID=A0A4R1N1N4_9FIRM|nr:DUF885 domain-containing protein [Natranaerovirga hydrolytica]TCL00049.1 uncharacterized protein (DUF885 family) [Natranaerovirga hydrolytica]